MILFPGWFFTVLVYAGIALAVGGGVLLLTLLLRDVGGKTLW